MSSHSKLIGEGATLIETVTRQPAADGKASDPDPALDDVTIHDGFYRIVQYDDHGNELSAYADDSTEDQIVMDNIPQLTGSAEWMFTRQWGPIKNGFTIVPKGDPSAKPSTDPQFSGLTIGNTEFPLRQMIIKSDDRFGVWEVRCDELHKYRLKDGSTKIVYYFRITEPGRGFDISQGVMQSAMVYDSELLVLENKVTWDPIDPKQLFVLSPLSHVPPIGGPDSIAV
ncbi:hypothetical protein FRC09_020390 [Ceratobasidium sp. 395]|nr:hypothetical protein FRC09_020390 [Ceratobasidium sp. 395]